MLTALSLPQPRPRPSKQFLDGIVTHFEGQMAQLGAPSQLFQKIYGYSSEDFDSLESFLFDFHSRFPGCSMNEVMRQSNRPLLKLKNTEEAYRYIGQDPQYADFKNILSRIWAMRDRLVVVRMAAAGGFRLHQSTLSCITMIVLILRGCRAPYPVAVDKKPGHL